MSETTEAPAVSGKYTLDPQHTNIGFVARHAMITKVRGSFNEFDGQVTIDEADPSKSEANLTIQVGSVDTRNDQRDGHLKTGDFLDIENHPTIEFRSKKIESKAAENYEVSGDLTIKGVTKPVSFDLEFQGIATDPFGNVRAGFEGSTDINRSDFGVNFNAPLETGGVLVSEKITLVFDISAVKES